MPHNLILDTKTFRFGCILGITKVSGLGLLITHLKTVFLGLDGNLCNRNRLIFWCPEEDPSSSTTFLYKRVWRSRSFCTGTRTVVVSSQASIRQRPICSGMR